jgi:hypothetical protein
MAHKLTKGDMRECRETWEGLLHMCRLSHDADPFPPDESETVMLSIGYADVWLDGDVVAHGVVLANVAED